MMETNTKRAWLLVAILVVGFSCIWLLPKSSEIRPTRLSRHLPSEVGSMVGQQVEVTGKELAILAKDTEFERWQYTAPYSRFTPPIQASIVFSGKDVNNSIHRPERCLKAQGWNFVRERQLVIPNALPDGGDMPVKEIVCQKARIDPKTNKVVKLENGEVFYDMQLQYYTFVGFKEITSSHYQRSMADIKGRLFSGYDQKWAYVTFSTTVTQAYVDQGLTREGFVGFSVEDCEQHLSEFITQLMPGMIDRDERKAVAMP
ncbi:exosortase-associated EpsI family protein [Verrucomicrobiaceae bacterium R5-34]|nr:exosortase-associated EpsI family protein [Verrucomicrobiaceae bacterium R5-34]